MRNETLTLSDTAMAQLYRGELGRSDRWRMRLDTTSNWALTVAGFAVSYSLSNANASHAVIVVGLLMMTAFLIIEARRYRYYDLWIHRVRLIEDGYWAPLLRHEPVDPDALKELALELERPQLQLSLFSALATRMSRVYGLLMFAMNMFWFAKVYGHPDHPLTFAEYVNNARLGFIPGAVVMVAMTLAALVLVTMFVASRVARPPLGELRSRRRSRKVPLWEAFSRPYAVKSPRRRERARPSSSSSAQSPVPGYGEGNALGIARGNRAGARRAPVPQPPGGPGRPDH
ncbi:MAG TPA: DUF2270 domain-containing protein [Myxococcaceae bacterium]|nr:DUF2270 domain-containing protein [Myxococcaceae bacterium]